MATKRLIDANVLEKGIAKMFRPYGDGTYPGDEDAIKLAETLVDVLGLINEQPTVDAVEVVHGRWEQIGYDEAMDRITCSHCKEYWNICDNDTETFNYCPNCGADMREGKGNDV